MSKKYLHDEHEQPGKNFITGLFSNMRQGTVSGKTKIGGLYSAMKQGHTPQGKPTGQVSVNARMKQGGK